VLRRQQYNPVAAHIVRWSQRVLQGHLNFEYATRMPDGGRGGTERFPSSIINFVKGQQHAVQHHRDRAADARGVVRTWRARDFERQELLHVSCKPACRKIEVSGPASAASNFRSGGSANKQTRLFEAAKNASGKESLGCQPAPRPRDSFPGQCVLETRH
jgi:hypothetical protein